MYRAGRRFGSCVSRKKFLNCSFEHREITGRSSVSCGAWKLALLNVRTETQEFLT